MRKITKEAAIAFLNGETYSKSNTTVSITDDMALLFLFGHLIAERKLKDPRYKLSISNAGWTSATTKERLNGLLSLAYPHSKVGIYQKNFEWYLSLNDGVHTMGDNQWIHLDCGRLAA